MREPLFIMCPGRSFSSVVCAVIGQHPQAFGLPELHLFAKPTVGALLDFDSPIFGRAAASSGLKRAVAELIFQEQTVETIEASEQWLIKRRDKTGAEVFRELGACISDRVLVDKSPSNSRPKTMRAIYRAFPNAYYLHLSRHPRATCRSQHKAYAKNKRYMNYGGFDHETYWSGRHETILDFGRSMKPGQYMFLHGEFFFEEPENYLKQICEWIDLPTDPDSIQAMMQPENSPFAVVGPENARYGNNVGFIENPHLRVGKVKPETMDGPLEWVSDYEVHFAPQTRVLAHQLGYDT